uniref:NADH dehydrogenase subunit 2 n=1 Tax=Palaemon macrodactylus TaxID=390956 RepID=UPI0024348C42|nr:NADH dehydrogenase subunit 2 [Palaemon macrodactylus]WEW73452.1 NADH dehydrogenase subunit 2 [Palaemon macrodactylus]
MLIISPALLLFSLTLMAGTLISISSSSWFLAWLGLELNLLSFIPLITAQKSPFCSEAALKYFLIQAFGSATLLISVTILFMFSMSPKILIFTSLILKMGAAPLHFWLPTIMQGMSWLNCLILMTIQKIAPLVLISFTLCNQTEILFISVSVFSAIMSGLGGLNQTFLRKLMAYSSINHTAWMLAAISSSTSLWIHYILTYSIISISVVTIFNQNQMLHIKHLTNLSSSPFNKVTLFMTLFSLGGLPPFLGFLPKMSVITNLVNSGFFIWALILTMSALITLFYYIRVAITSLTLNSPKTNQDINAINHKPNWITLMNLLLLLPLTVLIPL